MRICVLSHSNIALRQQIFWKAFAKMTGSQILLVSPRKWNNLSCESFENKNFKLLAVPVTSEGHMAGFLWAPEAFKAIDKFSPDIIVNQNEFWCKSTIQVRIWAKILGTKWINFVWDNLNVPNDFCKGLIDECALVIAGNRQAAEIHNTKNVVVQVGIDINHFQKEGENGMKKEFDLIFVGRECYEKGLKFIRELEKEFSVLKAKGVSYSKMPEYYNKAKILVVPSIDIPQWREQWPACIAEGLACELPVVTFDSGSIKDRYGSCKAVKIVRQGSLEEMKKEIKLILSDDKLREELGKEGRKWVINNYSHEAISKKLCEVFKNAI